MFTRLAKGAVYVGQDPTGGGFIRLPVVDMTPEQLAAWLLIDRASALRYVDPTALPVYRAPKIDNAPGAPLPKLPAHNEPSEDTTEGKPKAKPTNKAGA